MAKKTALISVFDKTGVVEFAKELTGLGYEIISTGGTSKTLTENNISVTEISKVTGFPEILGGRVKTLQPQIFGGILARRNNPSDVKQIKDHKINTVDIVVVNLYPFEETILKHGTPDHLLTEEIIENIDIGGVSLLRAAGKNFQDVLIICEPGDYASVLEHIKSKKVDLKFNRSLAAKAFRQTAYYDAMISNYISLEKFPEKIGLGIKKSAELRYGENPHQKAAIYKLPVITPDLPNLTDAKQIHGKELSYNNYLDLDAAWMLVQKFEKPACVIIKHNNPCGACEAPTLVEAYKNALLCDPVSAFGGIIAVNKEVDEKTAVEIVKVFTECIIAPRYTEDALLILNAKKNLRILVQANAKNPSVVVKEFRAITGGMLVQDKDTLIGLDNLKTATKREPSKEEMESLKFAWKIAKDVKSNAIILVRGTQTVGVGAGQMSRIDSAKIAAIKMNDIKEPLSALPASKQPLVLASDAYFPYRDVVDEAAKMGVTAIIQPGGSMRDDQSITAANEHNIAMIFTGMRHFKH
ncbi:MAG: bifunctional phosphoribosylaminoimidazolecarboxamide formyltransferase/IMP cyclohydrolase [Elusimicrobia bacterium RIFOXYA2_FULL_39_19]|nr:MAG: bifunctional phosphoribosylaminoimidazolecarboxamide formyltransferase/IMP cyclohydrolase [Elusimicrobia bacterium RIFOXYA2_FULL_39_19]